MVIQASMQEAEYSSPESLATMSNLSFLEELDEAAAKLDNELKAITEVDERDVSYCSQLIYDDQDDDDLTDELASLEYSKLALQQELNLSTLSFEELGLSPMPKVPELREEMEEASEIHSHLSLRDDDHDVADHMISNLHVSFDDDLPDQPHQEYQEQHQVSQMSTRQHSKSPFRPLQQHRLNIDISPIKPEQEEEGDGMTCTTRSRTSVVDSSNTHNSSSASLSLDQGNGSEEMTPKMQITSIFSAIHDDDDESTGTELIETLPSYHSPSRQHDSSLKILQQVASPTSAVPTLIPTYSEDSDEEDAPPPRVTQLEQPTKSEPSSPPPPSEEPAKKKSWRLPRRLLFTTITGKMQQGGANNKVLPLRPMLSVITNNVDDAKRKFKSSKRRSKVEKAIPVASNRLPPVSEDYTLPPPSTVKQPSASNKDQVLLSTTNPLMTLDNRERLVIGKMMKMLQQQEAKNKEQKKRERKLLHMLRDAWKDKRTNLVDHESEIQKLKVKFQDAFDNYQVLQQENEILHLQATAWKEISRQSNHQVAAYKHSYEKLHVQVSSLDEATGGDIEEEHISVQQERVSSDNDAIQSLELELINVRRGYEKKLKAIHQEKEHLQNELSQQRINHQVKLEEAKYQTELVQQDLDQIQNGYERKFESYIREKLDLKDHMNRMREEHEWKLQDANERAVLAEKELKELQQNIDSKALEVREEHHQAAINFEVANIRTSQLEQELNELKTSYKFKLEQVLEESFATAQSLKQLETKCELSNAKRLEAEQALQHIQDLLLLERGYHGDAKKSFQQQQNLLLQDSLILKKQAEDSQLELEHAQENFLKQEVELRKERSQLNRLLPEISKYQAIEGRYEEAVEEAKQYKENLQRVQEELKYLQAKIDELAAPERTETVVSQEKPAMDKYAELEDGEKTRDTLKYELEIAETNSLRDQVERLKIALKASSSPSYSAPSTRSPVEQRIRDQVKRLRKSLTPKNEDSSSSVFWIEDSPVPKEQPVVSKSMSPKKYVSMLRPKSNDRSKQAVAIDKENNGMLPKQRRSGGLAVRTGLGLR